MCCTSSNLITLRKIITMNSDQDQLMNCSGCGETPCTSHRLLAIGVDCKEHAGDGNKSVRIKLCKEHTRETHGVLGRGNAFRYLIV